MDLLSLYKDASESVLPNKGLQKRPDDPQDELDCFRRLKGLVWEENFLGIKYDVDFSKQLEFEKVKKELQQKAENLYVDFQIHLEFRRRALSEEYTDFFDEFKEEIHDILDNIFRDNVHEVRDETLSTLLKEIRNVYYLEKEVFDSLSKDFFKNMSYLGLPMNDAKHFLKLF